MAGSLMYQGWWAREDLNLGPLPCQGSALTPELRAPSLCTAILRYRDHHVNGQVPPMMLRLSTVRPLGQFKEATPPLATAIYDATRTRSGVAGTCLRR